MTPGAGWFFAIGAGRRVDYRVIAAPDFLVNGREYGVLGDVVRPSRDGHVDVVNAATPAGGPLTIIYSTLVVSGKEIAGADDDPGSEVGDVHDEQNRPLKLTFGFIIRGDGACRPDNADLAAARTAALTAYQEFLRDEEGFQVVATTAFRFISPIAGHREFLTTYPAPTSPPTLDQQQFVAPRARPGLSGRQPDGPSTARPSTRRPPMATPAGGSAVQRHFGLLLGLIFVIVVASLYVVLQLWPDSPSCPISPPHPIAQSSPATTTVRTGARLPSPIPSTSTANLIPSTSISDEACP